MSRELEKLGSPSPPQPVHTLPSTPEELPALPGAALPPSHVGDGDSEVLAVGRCGEARLEMPFGELVGHAAELTGLELCGAAAAGVTEAMLLGAVGEMPMLQRLVLQKCSALSERVAKRLGMACPLLAECFLDNCGLKNSSVMSLVSSPQECRLTALSLRSNPGLTDGSLMAVARNCKELQLLDLRGCSGVSDKGVEKVLLGCCQSLQRVQLWEGAQAVEALKECPHLKTLGLDGCTKIKFASLLATVQHCTVLSEIFLQGWEINDEERESLLAASPQLKLTGFHHIANM